MAIEEGLVISIGGDVSSLEDAIEQAQARINEAQDAIEGLSAVLKEAEWDKFTNGASYTADVMKPLQAEINSTKSGIRLWTTELKAAEEELKNLQSATKGVVGPTESAMSAQMAFNRVVRDSHSLLYNTNRGIAELTYAIPNFLSKIALAKEETGGWGGALQMAGSALISWPTLLMAGGTALAMWLRHHHEAKEASEDLSFSIENESKVMDAAKSEFSKASESVTKLKEDIGLAKTGFLSKDEVLKEYNTTIGKTVGLAKDLDAAEQALIKNGDAFVKMELYKAVAAKAREEAAKVAFEGAKKQMADEAKMGGAALNAYQPGMSGAELDKTLGKIDQMKQKGQEMIEQSTQKAENPWDKMAASFEQKAAEISKKFNLNFFDGKEDEKVAKVKTIDQIVKELQKDIFSLQVETKAGLLTGFEFDARKINAYKKAIEDIGKIDPNSNVITKLSYDINDTELRHLMQTMAKKVKEEPPIEIPVEPVVKKTKQQTEKDEQIYATVDTNKERAAYEASLMKLFQYKEVIKMTSDQIKKMPVNWVINEADTNEAIASLEKLNKQLVQSAQDMGKDVAVSFGEALGNTMNKGDLLKDFGKNLFEMTGQVIKKFGEQMIEAAGIMQGIKLAFDTMNPADLVIAGVGMVALGSVMVNSAPKLATGGVTTGPTLAMIGEGKEREAVLPLSRLNAMLNNKGGGNTMALEHRISGSDLVLWMGRANRTSNRAY